MVPAYALKGRGIPTAPDKLEAFLQKAWADIPFLYQKGQPLVRQRKTTLFAKNSAPALVFFPFSGMMIGESDCAPGRDPEAQNLFWQKRGRGPHP